MAEVKISGTVRTAFGKGASRRDRRDGNVPAVIYGHNEAPKHLALLTTMKPTNGSSKTAATITTKSNKLMRGVSQNLSPQ